MKYFAEIEGREYELSLERMGGKVVVTIGGKKSAVVLDNHRGNIRSCFIGDRRVEFGWQRKEHSYNIIIDGICYPVTVRDALQRRIESAGRAAASATKRAEVRAPIPGLVSKVFASPGAAVKKGDALITLDAMKLENEIVSPIDGKVVSIDISAGSPVEKNQLLAIIE